MSLSIHKSQITPFPFPFSARKTTNKTHASAQSNAFLHFHLLLSPFPTNSNQLHLHLRIHQHHDQTLTPPPPHTNKSLDLTAEPLDCKPTFLGCSKTTLEMDAISHSGPRTVEDVFNDFRGRRAGIIKALTEDAETFFQQCDPGKENLCLYGLPNETWEVNLPVEEVPPELPEPALGINFARVGMKEKDWLSLVAVHSDSWLVSVAFYFGARFGFGKSERKRLFQMINQLPTLFEVVMGAVKQEKDAGVARNNGNKSNPTGRMPSQQLDPMPKGGKPVPPLGEDENIEEEDDEQGATLCGACGSNNGTDEFWICCDICEKWFHGQCVKITPAKAEHIKQYKCPSCSSKRARV